jgi:HSP20 family protein
MVVDGFSLFRTVSDRSSVQSSVSTAAIAGFFAVALLRTTMSALSNALGELPDPVFADLYESETAYLLVIDLPGVSSETLDVRTEGTHLHIEARREKNLPMAFRYLREDRPLFLDTDLPLPPTVVASEADGSLERGTLTLRLPKREGTDETTIPITTGDEPGSATET